ncbi:MAG: hypothetical protein EON47_07640 [Acetobacteraceae bacterium]|nr:MAG: hypothetical protein EON47_07640 [Acetobacteraceae bacterium]
MLHGCSCGSGWPDDGGSGPGPAGGDGIHRIARGAGLRCGIPGQRPGGGRRGDAAVWLRRRRAKTTFSFRYDSGLRRRPAWPPTLDAKIPRC